MEAGKASQAEVSQQKATLAQSRLTANMPAFANLHPLQPDSTTQGALAVEYHLRQALAAITGMADFTLNPCAGAHGELTGLMIIRAYHEERGDTARRKVIVPDSAHGTNPASAAVCGFEVVEVKSTPEGRVDVDDLKPLLGPDVAAMMMTNPNTLGLFEREIPEIARLVHGCGALMYYDGSLTPTFVPARTVILAVNLAYAFTLCGMVSVHAEPTFEHLRYLFGGDRPSQTAHLTLSPDRLTAAG